MANLNLELTTKQKGYVYMVVGLVILLYAFNFFQRWLNTFVILAGCGLLAYGFIKVGGVEKVQSLISKKKH